MSTPTPDREIAEQFLFRRVATSPMPENSGELTGASRIFSRYSKTPKERGGRIVCVAGNRNLRVRCLRGSRMGRIGLRSTQIVPDIDSKRGIARDDRVPVLKRNCSLSLAIDQVSIAADQVLHVPSPGIDGYAKMLARHPRVGDLEFTA